MPRLLITGSRDWSDRRAIRWALLLRGPGTVVHGAARGADRIAGQIGAELGWPVEAHPADWRRGRGAGHLRNQAMVDLGADLCLAFPLPGSRGTWDCVRRANAADIPVVVWEGAVGRLWQVNRGDDVAGVVVHQGRVVDASVALEGAKGRPWPDLKAQLIAEGWHGRPV